MDPQFFDKRGKCMNANNYLEVKQFRDQRMKEASRDHYHLNLFHDEIVNQVLNLAILRTESRWGPIPCPFTFFVMGSAGRFEQSVWSDQDHGIIFQEQSDKAKNYFLALGNEISAGLHQAGYDYCDGGVMANNPLWCKSLSEWQVQLSKWMLESTWESIRHLLIFIDGRSIYGEDTFVGQLKSFVFRTIYKEKLLKKILSNTLYLKKGLGVFGQILVETHGAHTGSLNLKEIALFPYINAIRLLAIKGNILETSTLLRLDSIPEQWIPVNSKALYKQKLETLFHFRLALADHSNYETGHYIRIDTLTKEQKKEIKDILKTGLALYRYVKDLVEKEDSHGNE
jgi:CBS domain-containing protein